MQTLPSELLTQNIFPFVLDFNDDNFGEELCNLCLVCSEWAQCFYSKIASSLNNDRIHDELFWRIMIKSLNNNDENTTANQTNKNYSFRELFILKSIPVLDFSSCTQTSLVVAGTDYLAYHGGIWNIDVKGSNFLALHKIMMKTCLQLLYDGKSTKRREKSVMNAFDLVGENVLSSIELDYGRIYNERMANPYSEFIVKYDKRSIAGDFVISNAQEVIEKLRNAVMFVQTNNEELDQYYYFVLRKALYMVLLNRNVGQVEINDMVPKDEYNDNNDREMTPPEMQFQIPFPKDFDELEVFLEDSSSLILTNYTCVLYPCSCDIFTFMIFSKIVKGHAIFINIESTS